MKQQEIENWGIYWAGIAFISVCLFAAFAGADADPCQWEIDNAKSVCRALGRHSSECGEAIDRVQLCHLEGSTDPIAGLDTKCTTVCRPGEWGNPECTTVCKDN